MEIYKSILNAIVEPLTYHDEQRLHGWVTRLKQSDGEGYAIGEMLERALRYITMTSALANELTGHTTSSDVEPTESDT